MIKYKLTKLDTPGDGCWYEIPINQVKQLFDSYLKMNVLLEECYICITTVKQTEIVQI